MRKHSRAPPTFGRARALGISKGEVYAIVHDRLGKRVSSVKQLGEQSFKKLNNIMMALDGAAAGCALLPGVMRKRPRIATTSAIQTGMMRADR